MQIWPYCKKVKDYPRIIIWTNLIDRASFKRTYDVNYALRLPSDSQIELQRCSADFRNSYCPSEINTHDVYNCQKARLLIMSCMMFAPPTYRKFATCVYRKFATCVDWAYRMSHFLLAGVLLTAVSCVAAPFWLLCDHCMLSMSSWLIDVCIIKLSPATPEHIWSRTFKTFTTVPKNVWSRANVQVVLYIPKRPDSLISSKT